MISKAAIRAGTKAFGKSKPTKKRYKTQYITDGPYGEPRLRNIFYRSKKSPAKQKTYMEKKFQKGPFKSIKLDQGGTFPVSKSDYTKGKKYQKRATKRRKLYDF